MSFYPKGKTSQQQLGPTMSHTAAAGAWTDDIDPTIGLILRLFLNAGSLYHGWLPAHA